jgi:erythrocyte band 7 integral membrane protein
MNQASVEDGNGLKCRTTRTTESNTEDDSMAGSFVAGLIYVISMILIICTFPFSLCVCVRMVQEYERAVIFRLGRIKRGGAVGPGLFFIIPCMDNIAVCDLRTVSFDVPPQEILTKDSVTVAVDAVVYYKIREPLAAVCNVADYAKSTKLLASTTLRTILGTKNLAEILSDREIIAKDILTHLDGATDPWGIQVERVEVKDVRLPQQLQRAMAAEAEAAPRLEPK